MASVPEHGPAGELQGWKAIAEYLGVSARTVRNWEREKGLPVHRFEGSHKSPVWTTVAEVSAWRARGCSSLATSVLPIKETSGRAEPTVEGAGPNEVFKRSLRRWFVVGLVVALAGLTYALAHLPDTSNHPSDWRVAGGTLTVLGTDGRELWHHVFATGLAPSNYVENNRYGESPCVFADLDGDGRIEILFKYVPPNLTLGQPALVCFNSDGKIRWQFQTRRTVVDIQSREWPPPYLPGVLAVVVPRPG